MKQEILRINHLKVIYNQDEILSDISFSVMKGEIVSIIGNNGVGKTVLGKILSGTLEKSSGTIWFHGEALSGKDAVSKGIRYIPEDCKILENLTVAENLIIGQEQEGGSYLKSTQLFRWMQRYVDEYQFHINVKQKGSRLSEAKKRIVMLLRQMLIPPELLIIDGILELISFGDMQKIERLICDIVKKGTTVIYLTYNQNAAASFSNRILFLHHGLILYEMPRGEYSDSIMRRIRSKLDHSVIKRRTSADNFISEEIVLQVERLQTGNLEEISFVLKKGEIIGFIGLQDNVITEFLECLSGHRCACGGCVYVEGKAVEIKNPKTAIENGIRICGDRHEDMLFDFSQSIRMNLSLSVLRRVCKKGLIKRKFEDIIVSEYNEKFGIAQNINLTLDSLNYASVVKAAIASCMINQPKVLILNKAVRGLDENGMEGFFDMLDEARKKCGILLNFSKLECELSICSRIIFMDRKGIVGELVGNEINFANITKMIEQ